jgi:hypothetical protein
MPLPQPGYHNGSFFPGDRTHGDLDRWNRMDHERGLRESLWGCYPFYPFTYDPYPFYPYPWYDGGVEVIVYPGFPVPDYEVYPVYPVDPTPLPTPVGATWQRLEIQLDQTVTDGQLALTDLMGLDNYAGYSVESVEVYGDYGQWNPRTLQLTFDDGEVVDTETSQGGIVTLRPNGKLDPAARGRKMGSSLYDVNLVVSGTIRISRIVVNMRSIPTIATDEVIISQPILVDSFGATDIDVYAQANLAKYQGFRVVSIGVDGIASSNAALNAQLFVNTYNMGAVYLPNYSTSQEFYVNPGNSVIGMGMDSAHIIVNGSGQVKNLNIRLVRY